MKRSGIKARGRKSQAKRAERADVVAFVQWRDRTCTARDTVPSVACGGPGDVHEIIPRSAWPDGELVVENCVLVCRRHHEWIDANPKAAHEVGLHGFSWERPSNNL